VQAHGDEFEEIQQKIDSCAQQARTLEIQLAESQGEIGDRIGELETHVEASDKFAAQVGVVCPWLHLECRWMGLLARWVGSSLCFNLGS